MGNLDYNHTYRGYKSIYNWYPVGAQLVENPGVAAKNRSPNLAPWRFTWNIIPCMEVDGSNHLPFEMGDL